ncbi:MAG TPA: hypothetical protein GXZ87_07580 [Bacteroidales bacterium]|nr:hypothetical protein [Bacteroidales bacterium]
MIIAVDFDGTIVENRYPEIGEFRPGAVEALRKLKRDGYQLILWTCRTGLELARAVAVCAEAGIRFDAINANLRSEVVKYGSDSRKINADIYVDDRGLSKLPDWSNIYTEIREKLPLYPDVVINEGYL